MLQDGAGLPGAAPSLCETMCEVEGTRGAGGGGYTKHRMQRELCPSLLKTPGTTPPPPPGLLKNPREGAPEGNKVFRSN